VRNLSPKRYFEEEVMDWEEIEREYRNVAQSLIESGNKLAAEEVVRYYVESKLRAEETRDILTI
jgi:hypothetical protein